MSDREVYGRGRRAEWRIAPPREPRRTRYDVDAATEEVRDTFPLKDFEVYTTEDGRVGIRGTVLVTDPPPDLSELTTGVAPTENPPADRPSWVSLNESADEPLPLT